MKNLNYTCPKCSSRNYTLGEMRATGGFLTKIFDIQSEKFSYVTCANCSYTEFYKRSTSGLSNVFDLFT